MTLILLVMDGTKSLAANDLVMTSLGDVWQLVHVNSLAALERNFAQGTAKLFWDMVFVRVLGWPGWAVIGFAGLFLIVAGGAKNRR